MSGLFDLPGSRSSKEGDNAITKRSKAKSPSSVSMKGVTIIDKINLITQTVADKLGKYKTLYRTIQTEEELVAYFDKIIENGIVAIDTETTGLNVMQDKIAGLCLYTPGEQGVYIPINHVSYITQMRLDNQLAEAQIRPQIQRLVDNSVKCVFHSANFDIRVILHAFGVLLTCYYDTQIAANCLNENEDHELKCLHQKYVLGGVDDGYSFGTLFSGLVFTLIPLTVAYMYAARDPHITYELYEWQLPFLTVGTEECKSQELEGVCNIFWNIEMPFVAVSIDMEENGVAMDFERNAELKAEYRAKLDEQEKTVQALFNSYSDKVEYYNSHRTGKQKLLETPLKIGSPEQIAILAYDVLGKTSPKKKEPRGTGEEIISTYPEPVFRAILDYRGLAKLMNTYIDKLPKCVDPNTGKIHAKFNQYGARTGRLSSSDPKRYWALAS